MPCSARHRHAPQRFVRGDPGLVADLMTGLYRSDELFPDDICGQENEALVNSNFYEVQPRSVAVLLR
jgi:hypothetical protein